MADPLDVLANRRHQIPGHHLRVIDVEQHLDSRRIHPLADVEAPLRMRKDLIDAAKRAVGVLVVHVLDAERHVPGFEMSLDAVEKCDRVVRGFGLGQTAALPPDRDDVRCAVGRAHHDVVAQRRLELVLHFLVNQAVLECHRTGAGHRQDQPVFLQRRPVLLADHIESLEADFRGFAALVVERQLGVRAEDDAHQPLLETHLGRPERRRHGGRRTRRKLDLRVRGQRRAGCSRHAGQKFSANHVFLPGR